MVESSERQEQPTGLDAGEVLYRDMYNNQKAVAAEKETPSDYSEPKKLHPFRYGDNVN